MRFLTAALLLLLTGLSFGLRLGAVSRLLPVQPEQDASLVWTYREMCGEEIGAAMHKLHHDVYPLLLPRVLSCCVSSTALSPAPEGAPLEEHLAAASAPYLQLRWFFAAIAALLAPILFCVSRRWLPDPWALLAALFLALGLLHIAYSPVAKGHAAQVTFLWLAVLLALRQFEAPSMARVLASALAAAAAIGTMQPGLFTLPLLWAAALLTRYPPGSRAVRIAAWVAPVLALLGGLACAPGGLQIGEHGVTLGGTGHTILFSNLDGSGLRSWVRMFWEYDPVLSVLAGAGLLVLLPRLPGAWKAAGLRAPWLLVAAFGLPYVAVISLDSLVADRYLLPVYPLFALFAAQAVRALSQRLPTTTWRALAITALLALPAWTAIRYTWIGTRPSTLQQLARWIESQPGAASRRILLSPALSPPLFPQQASLDRQLETTTGRSQPWFYYLGKLEHVPASAPGYALETMTTALLVRTPPPSEAEVLAYLEEQRPDWIVLEVSTRMFAFPGTAVVYKVIREHGECLATLSGEGGRYTGEEPLEYQGARHLAQRIRTADAFGQTVQIFRWPSH